MKKYLFLIIPLFSSFLCFPQQHDIYRLKNVYNAGYINTETTLECGKIQPGWWSAMWIFEEVENTEYFRLKNVWKGTYLNTESNLQSSDILSGSWSAMWIFEEVENTEYYRIKNLNNGAYLNTEMTFECSNIQQGWWSAMWILEEVNPDYKTTYLNYSNRGEQLREQQIQQENQQQQALQYQQFLQSQMLILKMQESNTNRVPASDAFEEMNRKFVQKHFLIPEAQRSYKNTKAYKASTIQKQTEFDEKWQKQLNALTVISVLQRYANEHKMNLEEVLDLDNTELIKIFNQTRDEIAISTGSTNNYIPINIPSANSIDMQNLKYEIEHPITSLFSESQLTELNEWKTIQTQTYDQWIQQQLPIQRQIQQQTQGPTLFSQEQQQQLQEWQKQQQQTYQQWAQQQQQQQQQQQLQIQQQTFQQWQKQPQNQGNATLFNAQQQVTLQQWKQAQQQSLQQWQQQQQQQQQQQTQILNQQQQQQLQQLIQQMQQINQPQNRQQQR